MQTEPPKSCHRRSLSNNDCEAIVALYERGEAHGNAIAKLYDVHSNTVYRILKSAAAVKACRVHEIKADANAAADERQRVREQAWMRDRTKKLDAFIERNRPAVEFLDQLVKGLVRADRDGNLAEFGRELRATGMHR